MPAKRVLISIDERLLARIDQAASRAGATRSGYLAQLAEAELTAGGHGPGQDPSAQAALRSIDAILGRSSGE